MRVARLKLANVRSVKAAEFHFRPGINLIVGVNGVGKTGVLDALGVCLSSFIRDAYDLRTDVKRFRLDDVRVGSAALYVECTVRHGGANYACDVHKRVVSSGHQGPDTPQTITGGSLHPPSPADPGGMPLAVIFSTRRALASRRTPSETVAAGGVAAACAGAFANRDLQLNEFAQWMRARQTLAAERPAAGDVLTTFAETVARFLPGYSNFRVDGDKRPELLIDHGGMALKVSQLSDGERGMLAMVLDLTRRLAQANPALTDPGAEAEAVVLIDEIDLHLHPQWQRQIVRNLTTAFPRCQFIATTHSPQIIGEVEHDRIHIMADGEVYSPTHSFGVDSSRVLEEVMEADPRNSEVKDLLSRASRSIDRERFEEARELLGRLDDRLGDDDPDVTGLRTLLAFMEGGD